MYRLFQLYWERNPKKEKIVSIVGLQDLHTF